MQHFNESCRSLTVKSNDDCKTTIMWKPTH